MNSYQPTLKETIMNKVQQRCAKLAVKNGHIELAAKICVMASLQHHQRGVFVNDVIQAAETVGMSKQQLSGGLSALTAKGFYIPSSDPAYKGNYGHVNTTI